MTLEDRGISERGHIVQMGKIIAGLLVPKPLFLLTVKTI